MTNLTLTESELKLVKDMLEQAMRQAHEEKTDEYFIEGDPQLASLHRLLMIVQKTSGDEESGALKDMKHTFKKIIDLEKRRYAEFIASMKSELESLLAKIAIAELDGKP